MKKSVSIIVPVIHEDKAAICKTACIKNIGPDIEYELLFEKDVDGIGCPKMVNKLTQMAKYENVCFIGDDCIPQPGFIEEALKSLEEKTGGKGISYLYDGTIDCKRYCHFVFNKAILEKFEGTIFHEGYKHSYCDNELMERVLPVDGLWAYNEKALVLHDNPVLFNGGSGFSNSTYADNYAYKKMITDRMLFQKRKTNDWKTPDSDYVRVGLGLPLMDEAVDARFFESFVTMYKPFDWVFLLPTRKETSFSSVRNSLIEQAINTGCSHLIMLDTDQIYPRGALTQLLKNRDKDMVGTRVHRRYPPFDVLMFYGGIDKLVHVPDEECFSGELVKVGCTGTGCIMINMNIIPDVPHPWFSNDHGAGEDIYFCDHIGKQGKEVFVDTSIEIDHMTKFLVNKSTYELFKGLTGFKYRPIDMPIAERMNDVTGGYENRVQLAKTEIINSI